MVEAAEHASEVGLARLFQLFALLLVRLVLVDLLGSNAPALSQ
ncbi:MAG: hypothetical protein KatS3mg061_1671 [Dehalococcoidia bacterium]|nr:MAG: hypothetical protein KatS3mg061_1671 [Dehalococcoidia bacterium]